MNDNIDIGGDEDDVVVVPLSEGCSRDPIDLELYRGGGGYDVSMLTATQRGEKVKAYIVSNSSRGRLWTSVASRLSCAMVTLPKRCY